MGQNTLWKTGGEGSFPGINSLITSVHNPTGDEEKEKKQRSFKRKREEKVTPWECKAKKGGDAGTTEKRKKKKLDTLIIKGTLFVKSNGCQRRNEDQQSLLTPSRKVS